MEWKYLSDREKQLDRLIETCGIKLEDSKSCIKKVMRAIGADDDEFSFVHSRIQLRLSTAELLNKTDDFIQSTEATLDLFKKDDEEWKRRGRLLGYKF